MSIFKANPFYTIFFSPFGVSWNCLILKAMIYRISSLSATSYSLRDIAIVNLNIAYNFHPPPPPDSISWSHFILVQEKSIILNGNAHDKFQNSLGFISFYLEKQIWWVFWCLFKPLILIRVSPVSSGGRFSISLSSQPSEFDDVWFQVPFVYSYFFSSPLIISDYDSQRNGQ